MHFNFICILCQIGNDVGDDSEPAATLRNTSDTRGRKRPNSRTPQRGTGNSNSAEGGVAHKRNRRSSSGGEIPLLSPQRPTPPAQPVQVEEKPDANYRLKVKHFAIHTYKKKFRCD